MAEKERRSGKRLSTRAVSDATGLSKNTISKWARNEVQRYDRDVIVKFLEYFDCSISELLIYDE